MSLDFALLRNDEPEVQLPPIMVAQSGFSRHCVAQSSKFTPDFPLSPRRTLAGIFVNSASAPALTVRGLVRSRTVRSTPSCLARAPTRAVAMARAIAAVGEMSPSRSDASGYTRAPSRAAPRSGGLGRGGGTLCRGGNCGQLREASARSEAGLGRVAPQDVRNRSLLVPKVRRPATGAGIPDAGRRHPAHSASPSAARAAAPSGSGAGATAAGPLEQLAATGRPRKAGVRLERDVQASLGASFTVQGMSQGPPGPPPPPALARNRAPIVRRQEG